MKKCEIGKLGEDVALQYLIKDGHTILYSNFRKRIGEIDIISILGEVLYCTEVKTWMTYENFHPLASFNETKRKRMTKVYYYLLHEHHALSHLRVSFSLAHVNEKREVRFYSFLF